MPSNSLMVQFFMYIKIPVNYYEIKSNRFSDFNYLKNILVLHQCYIDGALVAMLHLAHL